MVNWDECFVACGQRYPRLSLSLLSFSLSLHSPAHEGVKGHLCKWESCQKIDIMPELMWFLCTSRPQTLTTKSQEDSARISWAGKSSRSDGERERKHSGKLKLHAGWHTENEKDWDPPSLPSSVFQPARISLQFLHSTPREVNVNEQSN